MKSYGCKLHPDQNFKLYKPAVKLHLSLITDPPLHRWYKRQQSVLCCSKRNHSPSSTLKTWNSYVSLCQDICYWQMFCRRNFPCTLVRNNSNSLGVTNTTLFRLLCRYHFTAALKRLQPDHISRVVIGVASVSPWLWVSHPGFNSSKRPTNSEGNRAAWWTLSAIKHFAFQPRVESSDTVLPRTRRGVSQCA